MLQEDYSIPDELIIAKINEIVETEDHNDKEDDSESGKDTEESENSESDGINIINAKINNIALTYEVLDVNSNLPQVGTSDTKLTNIQYSKLYRAKPEKRMGYTAGKSSISIVIAGNKEEKANLDTGAYFTCVDKNAFATDKEPLGAIIGHEVEIIVNVEKLPACLLRRPAYPASPRAREALEVHIKDLIDLRVLRKVGHNEQVKVTTPVNITWQNGKSRMVGDIRALNTYTVPDRYTIHRIHEKLTQLSQDRFITAMDALKGFHQNVLTDNAKKLLKIIFHCGVYAYLRIPFDGFSRWALANTPKNPAWVPQEEHHIEGICVTDIGTEFFNQSKERYKMDKRCHILCQTIMKDCKDPSLLSKLEEAGKKAYDEGRFHHLDEILYHRTKHTCVMSLTDRTLIKTILNEFHYSVVSGHLLEDRTLESVKICSWWPNWRKDVAEYCQTCDR
ncbi:hypothetical protein O181_054752 [Austropuccinia psidii MF-1]|uniref:Integrase zinc-binding domain-containing protein n=1 Tax=Austropuccinia psidii MF-1 TaxID=1389203 RepID=A0A9Q3HST8_9BASI|nr:hypothetical protein [Austropuccinia psidii MF-1]